MRVGSLFAGIGGFDLGLERAGFDIAWHCEIEPFAAAVLAKHWPHVPNHGDVRSVRGNRVEPVDLICGGFPCQDISVAGKGAGIDGERSGLWSEYARLVRECRPRWVVAENVPALRTRGYDRVHDDLEAAGYAVWPLVVGADDVGAPHRRKRVWIVAHADAQRREQHLRCSIFDSVRPAQRHDIDGLGARVSADAEGQRRPREGQRREPALAGAGSVGAQSHAADTHSDAMEGMVAWAQPREYERQTGLHDRARSTWDWRRAPEPCIRRVDDGPARRVDRTRRPRLAALGNALLPQIAEAIGRTILRIEAQL